MLTACKFLLALTVIPEIQYAVNGSYANFTCSPKVGNAYWVINGLAANSAHTSVQQMLVDEGYIFNDSDWSLTVSVPARELTNNTVIRCRGFNQGYSINNASLIVVDPTRKSTACNFTKYVLTVYSLFGVSVLVVYAI